jgi:hypothetical protein
MGKPTMKPRTRPSAWVLLLGTITLLVGVQGYYDLLVHDARLSPVLGALGVAAWDIAAIALADHALRVASDGDSPWAWNAAVVLDGAAASALQYFAQLRAGHGVVAGAAMACFPVITILLYEAALRRAARLNGRRSAKVAKPRAFQEPMMWVVFPRQSWRAFRLALRDRTLSSSEAFAMAYLDDELDQADPDPVRRRPDELAGQRSLADSIRTAIGAYGDDLEAVIEAVLELHPGAKPETVTRTARKFRPRPAPRL